MQGIVARIEQQVESRANRTKDLDISDVQTLLVGTYHKSGTVLMKKVFARLAARTNSNFVNLRKPTDAKKNWQETGVKNIIFDYKCEFADIHNTKPCRGVRVVRDPRMIIISGTRYHLNSKEIWLHQSQEELNGLTYQQHLNSLASFEEQVIFEMENKSREIISNMLTFNERSIADQFMTVKLEHLMQDESLEVYFAMFRHLGLSGKELVIGLEAALVNSVFTTTGTKNNKHMRGSASETWKDHFTPKISRHYERLFGDAHHQLGYD